MLWSLGPRSEVPLGPLITTSGRDCVKSGTPSKRRAPSPSSTHVQKCRANEGGAAGNSERGGGRAGWTAERLGKFQKSSPESGPQCRCNSKTLPIVPIPLQSCLKTLAVSLCMINKCRKSARLLVSTTLLKPLSLIDAFAALAAQPFPRTCLIKILLEVARPISRKCMQNLSIHS